MYVKSSLGSTFVYLNSRNNSFKIKLLAESYELGVYMKVIKIKLEYGCFPVWIYGENSELIGNDLPPYLIGDSDNDSKFVHIQEVYDSLYLDDGEEFKYIGFKKIEKKKIFL